MARQYNKKPKASATDALSAGLAAAMRPMIEQIVDQRIADLFGDIAKKLAPQTPVEDNAGDETALKLSKTSKG